MLFRYICLILGLPALLLSAAEERKDKNVELLYETKILYNIVRMELRLEMMAKELREAVAKVKKFTERHNKLFDNRTAELRLFKERPHLPLIAFNAYGPRDVSPSTNQIIVWQYTRLNEGDAYNINLGVFQAPVSGLYYFAVHVCHDTSQTLYYAITLDGFNIASTYKYDQHGQDCDSTNTVTWMRVKQKVWVRCTSGSSANQLWESTGRSSFIGALIHT